jgi:hypothetical protein
VAEEELGLRRPEHRRGEDPVHHAPVPRHQPVPGVPEDVLDVGWGRSGGMGVEVVDEPPGLPISPMVSVPEPLKSPTNGVPPVPRVRG